MSENGKAAMRVALITGAAGALGAASAHALAAKGWSLVLSGLPGDGCEALAAELTSRYGVEALALEADLADSERIPSLVEVAAEWRGALTCLVNNAARPTRARLDEISADEWDAVLAVNVRAPVLLMREFARCYRPDQHDGSIVNVASRTYATGGPIAYVASKAALVGATRAAAFELGERGIRVNAVAPSTVETAFVTSSRTPEEVAAYRQRQSGLSALKRLPAVGEIGDAVAYLAGRESSFVTGEVLHVAGGLQLPPRP